MAKQMACGDLMPPCKTVIEGKDEQEVLTKAAAHAAKEHGMATIPSEMISKVKAAIHEKR